jgi:hypothetical protein
MTTNRQQQDGGAWRELMAAVIVQAVKDAKSEQPEKALDAVLFLTGEDAPLWMEAVGLPDMDAVKFVTSGRARKVDSFFRK